jgi:hypothetical protein
MSAMLVSALTATLALGDTVGTGTFTVDLDLSSGLPAPFSGTLVFDNVSRSVFGTPVNLSAANPVSVLAPDMTHTQSRLLTFQTVTVPNSGTYEYRADSQNPDATTLAIAGTGNVVCDTAGCLAPNQATFVGPVSSLTGSALNGLPAACPGPGCLAYTSDGATNCCIGAACSPPVGSNIQHCTGVYAINAFQPTNTPGTPNCGSDTCVSVSGTYYDTRLNMLVSGTLDVEYLGPVPMAGDTTVTAVSNAPGAIPPQFEFKTGSFETTFFDLSTNTGYTGDRTVCIHYQSSDGKHVDGTGNPGVKLTSLVLLHYNAGTGMWESPPGGTTLDTANSRVCVTTTSFSPFAIAVQVTGLVPPDKPSLACEKRTGLIVAKLAKALAKCQARAAAAGLAAKDFDLGTCEADAKARFDETAATLVGCPVCAMDNRTTVRDGVAAALDAASVSTYCAGTVQF